MKLSTDAVLFSLVVVALAACGGSGVDDGPVARKAQSASTGNPPEALIGTLSAAPRQSAVVQLRIQIGESFASCSGTVITPTQVLTAAHCVPEGTSGIVVGLWAPDGTVEDIPAARWAVHPQFASTPNALLYDVAVVSLANALPNQTMGILVSQDLAAGHTVYMAGWGLPGRNLAVGAAVLDSVNLQWVGFRFRDQLSESCQGDSGGPVFRHKGARAGIVGITSLGFTVCGPTVDSRYTNAQGAGVIDFIRSQAPDAAFF